MSDDVVCIEVILLQDRLELIGYKERGLIDELEQGYDIRVLRLRVFLGDLSDHSECPIDIGLIGVPGENNLVSAEEEWKQMEALRPKDHVP